MCFKRLSLNLSLCNDFEMTKVKHLPKDDAKEAWSKLKTRYEPNTGTELMVLYIEHLPL